MAANTSAKVASNTGAAKDDSFAALITGLTEDNQVATLNVLSNDPGAARLYSLAQQVSGSSAAFPVAAAGVSVLGASLSINADGTIKYDASSVNLQSLSAGQIATDTFVYTVRMANGAVSTATATVELVGVNDAPLITNATSDAQGSVKEDGAVTATGQLSASDVDHGATQTWTVRDSAAGAYGSFAVDAATGQWSYAFDNAAHQALVADEEHTETFTVRVTDDQGAFVDQQVSVVVTGTNDVATISGVATAALAEDGVIAAAGVLTFADVDQGEAHGQPINAQAGNFGSFNINADGEWTFDLNNASANVQALAAGEQATDTFAVTSQDGSATQNVTVTVSGTNDAAVIGSLTNSSVTEDVNVLGGKLKATGTLAIADVDHNQSAFSTTVQSAQGNLGSLTLAANGSYVFSVDNALASVQALNAGQAKVDTFTVAAVDGTTKTLNFAINGANEATSTIVTFEDLANYSQIADGYKGFNWNIPSHGAENLYVLNGDSYYGTGYAVATAGAGAMAAYTPWGDEPVSIVRTNAGDFKFLGMGINAAWTNEAIVLNGYNNGVLVGTSSFNITTTAISNVSADWGYIDNLVIDVVGGSAGARHIVIDNFAYSL